MAKTTTKKNGNARVRKPLNPTAPISPTTRSSYATRTIPAPAFTSAGEIPIWLREVYNNWLYACSLLSESRDEAALRVLRTTLDDLGCVILAVADCLETGELVEAEDLAADFVSDLVRSARALRQIERTKDTEVEVAMLVEAAARGVDANNRVRDGMEQQGWGR